MAKLRPDREGAHRQALARNRKIILATQNTCGICGRPVDMSLKYPHPMSPTIDHIIPVNQNGHASSLDNLQLAHAACNRQKSDKIFKNQEEPKVLGNRNLPQAVDWRQYRADN